MKITVKETNKQIYRFDDLRVGTVFIYKDKANEDIERQIYIKSNTVSKDEIRIGAVNLSTGLFSYFGQGAVVELVEAELTIKRQ